MARTELTPNSDDLLGELRGLIDAARQQVAQTVNATP